METHHFCNSLQYPFPIGNRSEKKTATLAFLLFLDHSCWLTINVYPMPYRHFLNIRWFIGIYIYINISFINFISVYIKFITLSAYTLMVTHAQVTRGLLCPSVLPWWRRASTHGASRRESRRLDGLGWWWKKSYSTSW